MDLVASAMVSFDILLVLDTPLPFDVRVVFDPVAGFEVLVAFDISVNCSPCGIRLIFFSFYKSELIPRIGSLFGLPSKRSVDNQLNDSSSCNFKHEPCS